MRAQTKTFLIIILQVCNPRRAAIKEQNHNENDENDKRKLSERQLTLDFPHHEAINMHNSFQCGKFERLIFLLVHHPPTTTEKENYTSGRKLREMIKDDGEIFSNTNNFHCAPRSVAVTSHRENFAVILR